RVESAPSAATDFATPGSEPWAPGRGASLSPRREVPTALQRRIRMPVRSWELGRNRETAHANGVAVRAPSRPYASDRRADDRETSRVRAIRLRLSLVRDLQRPARRTVLLLCDLRAMQSHDERHRRRLRTKPILSRCDRAAACPLINRAATTPP